MFQLDPSKQGGFFPYSKGTAIPENPLVPALWPEASFLRLESDLKHDKDPQALRVASPLVVMRGITLWEGDLAKTNAQLVPKAPSVSVPQVHVLVRPSALCVSKPKNAPPSALLVTPHAEGKPADAQDGASAPLYDAEAVKASSGGLVREVRVACLPLGRYALSLSYGSGQGWITPNEAGACATLEGAVKQGNPQTCSQKTRPILSSQGPRAIIEVVPPSTDEGRAFCKGAGAPPKECVGTP